MNQYNDLDKLFKSMNKKMDLPKNDKREIQTKLNKNLSQGKSTVYFSKFKYHFALALAGIIFFILTVPSISPMFNDSSSLDTPSQIHQGTSISQEDEVKEIASSYADALEKGDVTAMVKYSDDVRFTSKDEQMEQYLKIEQNITDADVRSLKRIDESHYEVVIGVIQDQEETELTFPVHKKDGTWRIIVGQDF